MTNAVTVERKGHVLLIGLNRPEERNIFNMDLIYGLASALGELERDPELRCGVLFAHGKHFTLGLDLAEYSSQASEEGNEYPVGGIDPWGGQKPYRTKPLISAVHGICLTLGIELILNSDIRLAAKDTRFFQLEVQRGIFPFGGATYRFVRDAGWGNAMRYMLTGDEFSAEEAHRMGIIQEVVEKDQLLPRAIELAENIARQSPLGTQETIKNARLAIIEGEEKAAQMLHPVINKLFQTEDAKEGVASFLERRKANFKGC